MTEERDDDAVLQPPFNVVMGHSARMATLPDGTRLTVLQIQYSACPDTNVQEVTLLVDMETVPKLAGRLHTLSESDLGPPVRH